MSAKNKTVSVVVPIYNEQENIGICLDKIFAQTVAPLEVIVVDNNCTDKSIDIVKKYKKVRILHQPKQGLSFARNMGFDHARGDLLLRIDADTWLPNDYIERLTKLVTENPQTAGFTGYGVSRHKFLPQLSLPWNKAYHMFVKAYLGYPVLWGGDMAIHKTYWKKLKKCLINDDALVHEDQDLSLALASVGGRILISNKLTVSVQMEGLLHYGKYRQYGKMLTNLKHLDRELPRYRLSSRLPKCNIFLRSLYFCLTVPLVYGYYVVTIIYSMVWNTRRFMLAH